MRTTVVDLPAPSMRAWRPLLPSSSMLRGGVALLVIVIGAGAAVEILSPYSPTMLDIPQALQGPSAHHWLGTDQLGRDVFTRVLAGALLDPRIAFVAVTISFSAGTALGVVAGLYGGWADTVVMRLADFVLAFPFLILVIAVVFVLGPGEESIFIAVPAAGWAAYARIIRGQILVLSRQDFIAAARVGGLSSARIAIRHVLPNVITQAIVFAMSDMVLTMLAIVTLGYLGLGIPAPAPDWGAMISDGQPFLSTHWQLAAAPGAAIVITALALSLIADGLTDTLKAQ